MSILSNVVLGTRFFSPIHNPICLELDFAFPFKIRNVQKLVPLMSADNAANITSTANTADTANTANIANTANTANTVYTVKKSNTANI